MQTETETTLETGSIEQNETQPTIELIDAELRRWFQLAWEAIPREHPCLKDYCYFSLRKSGGCAAPTFRISGLDGCDLDGPTLACVLSELAASTPEVRRQQKIKALEAELAKLKTEAL